MFSPFYWLSNSLVTLFNGWQARKTQIETAELNHKTQREMQETSLAHQRGLQERSLERQRELQLELAELSREGQRELQEMILRRQRELQLELAEVNRESQRLLAAQQLENSLAGIEAGVAMGKWPLRLTPTQVLGVYRDVYEQEERAPLTVIVSPPRVQFERAANAGQGLPDIDADLARSVTSFLERSSGGAADPRPVRFLGGVVETKTFGRQALLEVLFHSLSSIPLLLIESEILGDRLHLWVGGWGFGREGPVYQEIGSVPYWSLARRSARERAAHLRDDRARLLAEGRSAEEVDRLLGDALHNIAVLDTREALGGEGEIQLQLDEKLRLHPRDFEAVHEAVARLHCLLVTGFSDLHYLAHYGAVPRLPRLARQLREGLLPEMDGAVSEVLGKFVASYRAVYGALGEVYPALAPELALELGDLLLQLGDRETAREMIADSAAGWLELRQLPPAPGVEVEEVLRAAKPADREYVQSLTDRLGALGDPEREGTAKAVLDAWALEKIEGKTPYDSKGPVVF